ncbi:MAG: MotE family protein [Nitrospirota bacterium]
MSKRYIYILVIIYILLYISSSYGVLDSAVVSKETAKGGKESDNPELIVLERKKRELEQKEERLKGDEERLLRLQNELNEIVKKYTKIRDEAEKRCSSIQDREKEYFTNLIKVYESMSPESAAARIEKMNKEIALRLLVNMKGKAVGKILSFIEPQKAAKFSEGFIKK